MGHTARGRQGTPSGLHGVFYDVIKRVDLDTATRLHEHWAPKSDTIAPAHYDERQRQLAGLLISTLSQTLFRESEQPAFLCLLN